MDSDADAQTVLDLEELTRLNTRFNSRTSFPGTSKEGYSKPKYCFTMAHPPIAGLPLKGACRTQICKSDRFVDDLGTHALLSAFCIIAGLYILLRIDSICSSLLYPISHALAWICSGASLLLALYAGLFCVGAVSQTRVLTKGFQLGST